MSAQWSQQLSRYVFSKVIERLKKSNTRINKKPSNTQQMNRVQDIRFELRKYKPLKSLEISKVSGWNFWF